MPDKEKRSIDAEKLADMLEARARKLRKKGLSPEDMDRVTGGFIPGGSVGASMCCGSTCANASSMCSGCNDMCAHSCIGASDS